MSENKHPRDKRRVMLTQLLRSPVFNSAGEAMGHLEDLIVKLDGGGYPPVSGMKVRSIGRYGRDVFVNSKSIETLAGGEVRLNTQAMDTTEFQRRPGEVLLSADVLGRHLMDVTRGRIVQAHDLVLAPSEGGWRLAGVDRSPRAMLRRIVPRRGRPDLRRHAILDWKDVQAFVAHVPTAKLLMPLQRLRRLHPAQIADLVEGATHAEGEEILDAVESDVELTADVFEELDTEHQVEFLKSLSNAEAARVLERMAPDDAADLFGELDQDRRKSIFDLMSPQAQHTLRKLLQYHPGTAGGMMSPDYVSVISGASVGEALEAIHSDGKSPRALLNTVFVIQQDGKLIGSIGVADLVRSEAAGKVDELDLVTCRLNTSADLSDVTLMVADYNLIAVAVTDSDGTLVGAVSSDDVIEAIVPEDWRARVEASRSV
jgi:CBS domain-containing protein